MNRTTVLLRSVARRLGLTTFLRSVLPKRDYEQVFSDRMMSSIREGDVVWDVGANVGFYTLKFVDAVKERGRVVAFEPSPESARLLEQNAADTAFVNLQILNVALGNSNGTAQMIISDVASSPTNRICADRDSPNRKVMDVPIYTGDTIQSEMKLAVPNIIKVDVEGFEQECLEGLQNILAESKLRAIFVEVHFGILQERGMQFTVAIEQSLASKGFNVQWIDSSHLAATRTERSS